MKLPPCPECGHLVAEVTTEHYADRPAFSLYMCHGCAWECEDPPVNGEWGEGYICDQCATNLEWGPGAMTSSQSFVPDTRPAAVDGGYVGGHLQICHRPYLHPRSRAAHAQVTRRRFSK